MDSQVTEGTDHAQSRANLKVASVSGIAVNFAAQMVKFGLTFLYQILLARLLQPADFGVVAMAAPVLAFVGLFADFGLTQATVQRANISQQQLTLIFWINCLLSLALAIITVVVSPLVGRFYHNEQVTPIVVILGSMFFLGGLYAQHLALLNRRLAFAKLAVIDLVGFLAGAAAAIAAAMLGLRYWAIIINGVVTGIVTLVLAWMFTRWVPGRPQWAEDARALLGFGGNITTFNVVNYFARNLDNVLIGKYVGVVGLGLYDRAYKLLLLPLSQITGPFAKVATPLLAQLLDDPPAYRRAYTRMLEAICLLTFPGVVFAMVSSKLLIDTVLGSRWDGVAPIFSVLAIGAFFAPISNSTGWLFITQDRTREMRNWGVVSSAMFVLSFILGLRWGAQGVANSYVAVGALQGPLIWWAVTRRGPLSFVQLLSGLFPHGVALAVTIVGQIALQRVLPYKPWALIALGAAAYPVFVLGLGTTVGGRQAIRDVAHQARDLLGRLKLR